MRRRLFLRAGVAISLGAIAGCSGTDDETPTDSSPGTQTETPAETARATATPEETPTADETPPQDEPTTTTETEQETETATEDDDPDREDQEDQDDEDTSDRPANYRWDIKPGRNNELRNQLGQYVESVGPVRQNHPAFQYSTDQENDDHTVDFEALRMIRDSNFDIFVQENPDLPLEKIVESFTDDSLYEQSKNNLFPSHPNSPRTYDKEAWLNADTVEESLDLGHNLLITIDYDIDENVSVKEKAVSIREAYQRHHDFDVLAWEVPMNDGALTQGMMYSPDDDKIRSFAGSGDWNGEEGTQYHTEIQNWDVINDPNDITDADRYQHPIMFHTDEWNRQGVSFETAKDDAVGMIFDIATEDYNSYNVDAREINDAISQNITMTTGATEQLTRTMLEYNESGVDADFSDIRDLASFAVGKYLEDPEINGVIDTVNIEDEEAPENGEYSEYFEGGFAFYELEDEELVDEVRNDRRHEYDNFAAVFDDLETAA
jgi:hypothetical protein